MAFNFIQRAKTEDVEYRALPLEEVMKMVEEAERKRRARYERIKKS
jgi:hypothetical protein